MDIPNIRAARHVMLLCKSFNHHLRHAILEALADKPMTVTQIQIKLRIEDQPTCSQHLAVLRNAGLIYFKRSGKNSIYHLDTVRLNELKMCIETVSPAQPQVTHHSDFQNVLEQTRLKETA